MLSKNLAAESLCASEAVPSSRRGRPTINVVFRRGGRKAEGWDPGPDREPGADRAAGAVHGAGVLHGAEAVHCVGAVRGAGEQRPAQGAMGERSVPALNHVSKVLKLLFT